MEAGMDSESMVRVLLVGGDPREFFESQSTVKLSASFQISQGQQFLQDRDY